MSTCATCPRPQGSRSAENQTGMEIQIHTGRGWEGLIGHQYVTCCEAQAAFRVMPTEGFDLRVYPILNLKKKER